MTNRLYNEANIELEEIEHRIDTLLQREVRYIQKHPSSPQGEAGRRGTSPVSILHRPKENIALTLGGKNIRSVICEWMFKVVDHYSLERETIPIAMSYFDRYIAINTRRCNTKDQCQLLALTSLYTAVKLHDTNREGTIKCFSKLSNGRFSPQEIEAKEKEILNDLKWLMNPPTPQAFVYDFVDYLSATIYDEEVQRAMSNIYEVANYAIEVALFRSPISQEKASTLAFASFLVAMGELKGGILSPDHFNAVVASILSFDFASLDEIASVGNELMNTLKNSNGYADMQKIYERLDPERVIYEH